MACKPLKYGETYHDTKRIWQMHFQSEFLSIRPRLGKGGGEWYDYKLSIGPLKEISLLGLKDFNY